MVSHSHRMLLFFLGRTFPITSVHGFFLFFVLVCSYNKTFDEECDSKLSPLCHSKERTMCSHNYSTVANRLKQRQTNGGLPISVALNYLTRINFIWQPMHAYEFVLPVTHEKITTTHKKEGRAHLSGWTCHVYRKNGKTELSLVVLFC